MSAADRLAGIKGHEVKPYGQSSYEGDFCRQCGWQGPPRTGQNHNIETRTAAIEAALLVHDARVKAEALREAAADLVDRTVADYLRRKADRIEAAR